MSGNVCVGAPRLELGWRKCFGEPGMCDVVLVVPLGFYRPEAVAVHYLFVQNFCGREEYLTSVARSTLSDLSNNSEGRLLLVESNGTTKSSFYEVSFEVNLHSFVKPPHNILCMTIFRPFPNEYEQLQPVYHFLVYLADLKFVNVLVWDSVEKLQPKLLSRSVRTDTGNILSFLERSLSHSFPLCNPPTTNQVPIPVPITAPSCVIDSQLMSHPRLQVDQMHSFPAYHPVPMTPASFQTPVSANVFQVLSASVTTTEGSATSTVASTSSTFSDEFRCPSSRVYPEFQPSMPSDLSGYLAATPNRKYVRIISGKAATGLPAPSSTVQCPVENYAPLYHEFSSSSGQPREAADETEELNHFSAFGENSPETQISYSPPSPSFLDNFEVFQTLDEISLSQELAATAETIDIDIDGSQLDDFTNVEMMAAFDDEEADEYAKTRAWRELDGKMLGAIRTMDAVLAVEEFKKIKAKLKSDVRKRRQSRNRLTAK
jgi:hypothetical protein